MERRRTVIRFLLGWTVYLLLCAVVIWALIYAAATAPTMR